MANYPFVFFLNQLGDFELTGNFGLAESAPCDLHSVFGLLRRGNSAIHVLETFVFVVASNGNSPGRAAGRTDLAGFVIKVEAVRPMGAILFRRWLEDQIRYNAADAHGLSLGRDQPVTQSEKSQDRRRKPHAVPTR